MLWRRSYDVPPPDIELGSEFSQDTDPRYAGEPIPRAEALAQVLDRALPYWHSDIVPDLQANKTVLVAAHGNSIRAIVKYLDDVDDQTIAGINIPTGIPLRYDLDEETLKPTNPGGTYLDPEAAAEAIKAVANQGR
jgi:2,3-bisphosphoglycerate-dependent phosphoglycerate mutase